jgi:putative CocE/NonD family hydrolase
MADASDIVIQHDVAVPMRDGVVLRADVYRPSSGVHPVLLQRTPYSKDVPVGLMVVMNPVRAARAGYAVVVQDVRGRFRSEGDFVPFVNEAQDGYDSVEWAAAQPWSTGAVGMFGSSYMAATQLQAATTAPPHLRAICPMEGSSDYFEGRSYRGGAFEIGAMLSIALFALGSGSIYREGLSGEEFRVVWRQIRAMLDDLPGVAKTTPLTGLRDTIIGRYMPYFFDWLEHDEPGEYWRSFSVESGHDRIGVPALHVSSWYDNYSVGAIANYLGISAHGATEEARANQYLWLGPWGHYMPRTALNGSARLGEVDFGLSALIDLDVVQLSWFDRWLKDDLSTWRFDAPVRVFVLGENRWRDLPEWPAPTDDLVLHLGHDDAGGRLAAAPAASTPQQYTSDPDDPVPTIGGAHLILESAFPQGPWDQRELEARSDVLVFSTEPLTEDLDIVGTPVCEVWVSSTAPSIDVVATLTVVRDDGTSILVVDGVTRADIAPGAVTRVEVVLAPTAQRFRSGERVRLRIAGSNFPRWDLNPQTGERSATASERVAATQQLFHDAERPSALHLPVAARARR